MRGGEIVLNTLGNQIGLDFGMLEMLAVWDITISTGLPGLVLKPDPGFVIVWSLKFHRAAPVLEWHPHPHIHPHSHPHIGRFQDLVLVRGHRKS